MVIGIDGPCYYASNIDEAVRIALELKREGKYDLFRGQIRSFPLQPSLFRLGDVDRRLAVQRLNEFATWVHSVPELESLHRDNDAILAVAQHYGIKTTLLDFTTNPFVAGFFASDGMLPKVNKLEYEPSCIICARQKTFEDSWRDINERSTQQGNGELVRVVKLDVRNLWRLQAQEGLFIDARIDPTLLETFSFFFRIQFLYSGPFNQVRRASIYPVERSHLEILFEEYVFQENFKNQLEKMHEVFDEVVYEQNERFMGVSTAFVADEFPPVHPSWDKEVLMDWLAEPDERYRESLSKYSIRITLREAELPDELSNRIRKHILRAIRRNKNLRQFSIKWTIFDADGNPLRVDGEIEEHNEQDDDVIVPRIECRNILSGLWDGMRRLPYSDEQLAACFANYVCLEKHDWIAAKALFGNTLGVEFSTEGAICRAFVSSEGLMKCVREDFMEFLTLQDRQRIQSSARPAYEAISILVDPSRLFNFLPFADLFAREVIPSQMWFRLNGNLAIFSPARLTSFGND